MPHPRFATIPVYADSTGHELIPSNAVSVGTIDPIAECEARKHALDERERELHELEHQLVEWDAALHERRVNMDAAAASRREAIKHGLLADVLAKLDDLAARMDAYEEYQRANDPEFQITLPPGTDPDPDNPVVTDAGELQATKQSSSALHPEYEDPDDEPELEPPPELRRDLGDEGELPKELTQKVPPETGTEPELSGHPRNPTARPPVSMGW
jgi:hypothetical protein